MVRSIFRENGLIICKFPFLLILSFALAVPLSIYIDSIPDNNFH